MRITSFLMHVSPAVTVTRRQHLFQINKGLWKLMSYYSHLSANKWKIQILLKTLKNLAGLINKFPSCKESFLDAEGLWKMHIRSKYSNFNVPMKKHCALQKGFSTQNLACFLVLILNSKRSIPYVNQFLREIIFTRKFSKHFLILPRHNFRKETYFKYSSRIKFSEFR